MAPATCYVYNKRCIFTAMRTYEETMDYMYAQLPMYSRMGAPALKYNLDNIISLCNFLDNPQEKFASIHVAGTNGKGSVCHMLAAMLQKAGYNTGLTTSPHIHHYEERIRVNGQMIEKDFVVAFINKVKNLVEKIKPSFFELSVAMAFDYFAFCKVDIAVIETGLGGRLDSTNIISPVLSIITNISLDHTHLLGNTLEEIAAEKAGIIKQQIPVIIGEILPETINVFEKKSSGMQAPMYLAEKKYMVQFIDESNSLLLLNVKNLETEIVEKLRLDLTGIYQAKNILPVLMAREILATLGWPIPEKALHEGLENTARLTGIKGRWQLLKKNPDIIADVAHNEDGLIQVLRQLENHYPDAIWHFVMGFAEDKNLDPILNMLPPAGKYYFTQAPILRALPHNLLKEKANLRGLNGASFEDVNAAVNSAQQNAGEKDVVIICGSFYVIAALREDWFPNS
ncbi:MAG: folylpolyglutamate synthase/dihydrofolate synthase family protein [Ferruginibacter sp.]